MRYRPGVVMVMALFLFLLVTILVLSMLRINLSTTTELEKTLAETQAQLLADSGVEHALEVLAQRKKPLWEQGSIDNDFLPGACLEGTGCLATRLKENYPNNLTNTERIVSPPITLPSGAGINLSIYYYRFTDTSDSASVEISQNGGHNFTTLQSASSNTGSYRNTHFYANGACSALTNGYTGTGDCQISNQKLQLGSAANTTSDRASFSPTTTLAAFPNSQTFSATFEVTNNGTCATCPNFRFVLTGDVGAARNNVVFFNNGGTPTLRVATSTVNCTPDSSIASFFAGTGTHTVYIQSRYNSADGNAYITVTYDGTRVANEVACPLEGATSPKQLTNESNTVIEFDDVTVGGWVEYTASLDAYAGKTIRLAFSLNSDANTSRPGLVVDRIRITQGATTVYSENFNQGFGEWKEGLSFANSQSLTFPPRTVGLFLVQFDPSGQGTNTYYLRSQGIYADHSASTLARVSVHGNRSPYPVKIHSYERSSL